LLTSSVLGINSTIAHLESLSAGDCDAHKAAEISVVFAEMMVSWVGHQQVEDLTAAFNKAHTEEAHTELLEMTGLQVTDATPVKDLVRAEIRIRAVVHADKVL
jgi:hypothetical protein